MAKVSGATSVQWLTNNVPVPGATNQTLEGLPLSSTRYPIVLVASNTLGVSVSSLLWSDACDQPGREAGALQFTGEEPYVLDWKNNPWEQGQVNLYVALAPEALPGPAFQVPATQQVATMEVRNGLIDRTSPIFVPFRPGTRVYAQFRLFSWSFGGENSRSRIFEATVGTETNPGSLDALEPFAYYPWDAYGISTAIRPLNPFKTGPANKIEAIWVTVSQYAPPGTVASLQWRKNGVPIPGAIGPALEFAKVTLADAGTYELLAADGGYTVNAVPLNVAVSIGAAAKLELRREQGRSLVLSIRGDNAGTYRLEKRRNWTSEPWELLLEGSYTNIGSSVELPVLAIEKSTFYRLN